MNEFAFWLLCGLASLLTGAGIWFLKSLIDEIKETKNHFVLEMKGTKTEFIDEIKGINSKLEELNDTLTKVVANQEWHGKELLRLEWRIHDIECKYRG